MLVALALRKRISTRFIDVHGGDSGKEVVPFVPKEALQVDFQRGHGGDAVSAVLRRRSLWREPVE